MRYKISDLFSLFQRISILLLLGAGLASCGSSSSSGGGTTTLSGTAATGIAIDGVVNVYGSNGGSILDVDIDASGNYTADVSGLTAPFFVCAEPTNTSLDSQYSFAAGAGTTNITPMTTLTLFYANGDTDPSSLVANWPTAAATVQAAIADAQAVINANFVGVFAAIDSNLDIDFTTFDFFSTSFAIGDVFDQILDLLSIDISGATPVISVTGLPTFNFDPNAPVTGIDIGGIGGGSSNGTGSSTTVFGGNGLIDLPALSGNAFTPELFVSNAGLLTWSDNTNDIIIVAIPHPGDATKIVTITVTYTTGGVTWQAFDALGIQDVTYDGTTVTMVGLGLLSAQGGVGSLLMNGTLAP